MSSAKLDAVNDFIKAARLFRELIEEMPQKLESGMSSNEVMQYHMQARLDLVRAALKVSSVSSNPEADKIVGEVLLGRIDDAARSKTPQEWEDAAQPALNVVGEVDEEEGRKIKQWMADSAPLVDLGWEALRRSQDQQQEIMIEGFRRAAETTPGSNFRFTEVVNDQVIKDETILGPTSGEEDTPERGTGRLSGSTRKILGVDDEMLSVDTERLVVRQKHLIPKRHGLKSPTNFDDVRLTIAQKMIDQAQRDLSIAAVTGELPTTISGLGTEHFPALRVQLLMQHYSPLIEGSVYSRTQRGDRSAVDLMQHLVIVADMLATADPYFLPRAQIKAAGQDAPRRDLPENSTFLVWHDEPVAIGGDLRALAWVFASDERGNLDDVANIIMLHSNGELEAGLCSLKTGEAAATARAVADTLSTRNWVKPKDMELPGKVDSRPWRRALGRSVTRARQGAIHGLYTLAKSD